MTAQVEILPTPATGAVPKCPFPGLRSFTEEFTRFYFGREAQRDECIRRLQDHRFLAVIGSSGSGKSSLIKAGLWPALQRGLLRGAEDDWLQVLFQPGADPMDALARALCSSGERTSERLREVHRTLRSSARAIESILLERVGEERPSILLCVDQFEELFRLGKEQQTPERWRADRVHFIHTVLRAREAQELRIYVVTTMRTDFLEDCTNYPELPEALNEGQFLVPELSREQLEHAVARPAEMQDVKMSRALVRRVLSDATSMKDSLPVLQHALRRTWNVWAGLVQQGKASPTEIGLDQYTTAGTAREALDRHGNEVLEDLGKDRDDLVKLIFQRLTLTNADGKITRSPTSLENLIAVAKAKPIAHAEEQVRVVVERFRREDCHFLASSDRDLTLRSEIDMSHEAVCRVWKRLAGAEGKPGWIALEHKDRLAYSRLCEAAQLHGAKEGQLLDDDFLVVMERWWHACKPTAEWAARYHLLDEKAQHIIEQAKKNLLGIEPTGDEAEREAREAIQQSYRAQLGAWHRQRFEATHGFLLQSRAAKDARDAKAQRDAAALQRTRIFFSAAMGMMVVLVIAGIAFGQHVKLNQLGRDIANRENEVAELSARIERDRDQVDRAGERIRAAQQQADEADQRSRVAKEQEEQAQVSLRAKNAELTTVNEHLAEERDQLRATRAQNTKLKSELAETRAELKSELAKKRAELMDKEAELMDKEAELMDKKAALEERVAQVRKNEERIEELMQKETMKPSPSLCALCAFRGEKAPSEKK
jgi:hypothetical protein